MRRFVTTKSKYSTDPNLVLNLPLYETGLKANIFASYDIYAHKCSVTGATWGLQGRLFVNPAGFTRQYIECLGAINPVSAITLVVWVKAVGYTGNDEDIALGKAGVTWRLGLQGTSGLPYAMLEHPVLPVYLYGSQAVGTTVWHHLAVTHNQVDGSKLFVDGNLVGEDAGTEPLVSSAGAVYIGALEFTKKFNGYIGEVRVYNRALSEAEIQHNYLVTKWRYL